MLPPANFKLLELDAKVQAKTWIELIVRAVEEDLAKTAIKCGNKYCSQVKEEGERMSSSSKRETQRKKEWLCSVCTNAYDQKQFCEFCSQIYLENTNELSALDGKEWAQCEDCERWTHVDCLGREYNKTRDEVVAASFKYICCECNDKVNKKRKRRNSR